MKKQQEKATLSGARENVFEDLGFSRAEALELKVRSEIYRELVGFIRQRRLTQAQIGALLGIHQPDVSHLMTGKLSKFSVGKLIQFASRLDMDARITVTMHPVRNTLDVLAKATPIKKRQTQDKEPAARSKRQTVLA